MSRFVDVRLIALVLALATLGAGLPTACEITLDNSQLAFTLDICHPAQVLGLSAPTLATSPLNGDQICLPLDKRGTMMPVVAQAVDRLDDAPDPPPPEALA